MWKSVVMAFARSVVVTALNVAAERVLASVDSTDKLGPAEKEAARGAILQFVQELGKEIGTTK